VQNIFLLLDEGVIEVRAFPYRSVEPEDVGKGTSKLKVRWLITNKMGAKNFAMRLFEMEPGGYSPLHSHHWEHEVFILGGEGVVTGGSEERRFKPDDVIFIPPEEVHQFRNDGKKTVKFLCLIPCVEK
jgi:quercetin dioxygenase-like cupin family protein